MTIQQMIEYMIATATRYPGYPVSIVIINGEVFVGMLNFEPDHDDWYQEPTPVLTSANPVIESRDRQAAQYGDVAQRQSTGLISPQLT